MTVYKRERLKNVNNEYIVTPSMADMVYHNDGETVERKYSVLNNDIEEGKREITRLEDKINSITLNVKDFGAIGDGVTDDSAAIQKCLDYASKINNNTTLAEQSINIIFPYGVYGITRSIIMSSTAIIEFNNSQILALNAMDVMWTFRSNIQIPSITLKDMVIHGNGLAKKGLVVTDTTDLKIYDIKIFSCIEHHMLADSSLGKSTMCGFYLFGGEFLNGINPNAGRHLNCADAIGLEVRTTDIIVRDLITRDFRTHIYNVSGTNFYDHCHGWNQYNESLNTGNSVHFKLNWDAMLVNCYSDTITNAFEIVGDGRYQIVNHQVFINNDFYNTTNHGTPKVIKGTFGNRTSEMFVVNSRFDNNGNSSAIVCDNENYAKFTSFLGCNNNFKQGNFVVGKFKLYDLSNITVNSPISIWNFSLAKRDFNEAKLKCMGDIPLATVNNKQKVNLFTLPNFTFNQYSATSIYVNIKDYGNSNEAVMPGEISEQGVVSVNLKQLPFTAGSDCKFAILADYHIIF